MYVKPAPEDALVIAEVLRRLMNLVGDMPMKADGRVNHRDLYLALADAVKEAEAEVLA